MLEKMIRPRHTNVALALCATGLTTLIFCGCGKSEPEVATPSHAPESYMYDKEFRRAVAEKAAELRAIVKERAPLAERMKELVKEYREDLAALQKVSEWNDLHKRVVQLNEKYEEVRKRQLVLVGKRIAPPKAGREKEK